MKHYTNICSLLMVAFCGCAQRPHPPAEFSERLLTADHIVVTNDSLQAFSYSVSGEEVGSLAKAIAVAREDVGFQYSSMYAWHVQFYAGTNLLGKIRLQGQGFLIEDREYTDYSGVLKMFHQKLVSKEEGQ